MQKDKNGYRKFLEPHDLSKYMAGTKSINVARFQRDARTRCKIFSENGTFQVKREHQTKYFDTRSYKYGVVISRHISDVNDITQEEKKRLSAMFDDLNLPPCITETHI